MDNKTSSRKAVIDYRMIDISSTRLSKASSKTYKKLIVPLRGRSLRFVLWRAWELIYGPIRKWLFRYETKIVTQERIEIWFGKSKGVLAYLKNRRTCAFYAGVGDAHEVIRFLSAQRNDYSRDILYRADQICNNTIDILSRGDVFLGSEIDWLQDYSSGLRWELGNVSCIDFIDLKRPSDVRVVWELNRLHFLANLGKAYRITNDDKYVRKFVDIFRSWCAGNPVARSINWANGMEVAIRAVNMIWAFEFCMPSEVINNDFSIDFLQTLIIHGRYIFRNLEYNDYASNHYIADLVGLVFLGIYLNEYPEAQRWLEKAIKELEDEVKKQIYTDGVDYEKSLPYHRLVTEMLLSTTIYLQRNRRALSSTFMERLESTLQFVQAYIAPNGSCPMIGDNDDGRFHWLGSQAIDDHRYLLSTGAVLFNRSDFKRAAGIFWEESAWLLGVDGITAFSDLDDSILTVSARKSSAFEYGCFFIMCKGNDHLVVDCGDVGRRGYGGHGHNDVLSFVLTLSGENFLVDSGSSKYTSNWEVRQSLLSTRAHNLLMVDGEEISEILTHGIGGVANTPARIVDWQSNPAWDQFVGEHYGYHRLSTPITHRRTIKFEKEERKFYFIDDVFGEGLHRIDLYFHFDPNMQVVIKEKSFHCISSQTNRTYRIEMEKLADLKLHNKFVYKQYGIGSAALMGSVSLLSKLPIVIQYQMYESR